jgi:HEAT repeat protein
MSRPRKDDQLLVLALAQGKSQAEAGRITGFAERTVRSRLQDEDFRQRVEAARVEVTAAAAAQLASLYPRAIGALSDLLDDPEPSVKLRAAQAVLKTGPELKAHLDFEQRLLEIEASVRNAS